MVEVHAGTRPGHRTLLLMVTAGIFAASLGAAWMQVHQAQNLGPEQAISGTPLLVRAPRHWIADPNQPGSFVLPVRRGPPGQEGWEIDRRVHFGYERSPIFEPPAEWLATHLPGSSPPEPARIGPLAAVQARQLTRRRVGREITTRESIVRIACLPRGDVIHVEYIPMADLTMADLELFDRICAAIRLDDPALAPAAQAAMQRAGLHFELDRGTTLSLPHFAEVAGMYVGGVEDALPAWSLGLFRTWLAGGRTPRDILLDFAAGAWLPTHDSPDVHEATRADGARVASVLHPDSAQQWQPIVGAWLVTSSPAEAVLIIVYSDDAAADRAAAAAQRIADHVTITPVDAIGALEPAEQAGVELARLINQKGALPWWGRDPAEMVYSGHSLQGDEAILMQRSAMRGDPARGYEGNLRHRRRNQNWQESSTWSIDNRAIAYSYRLEFSVAEGLVIGSRERRAAEGDLITRTITLNDMPQWSGTFRPGPAFVGPPVESLAEALVAQKATAPTLIEVSSSLGHGSHSRLLRPLPAENGLPRVISQEDYRPQGAIMAYDENEELRYQIEPDARYDRAR